LVVQLLQLSLQSFQLFHLLEKSGLLGADV
jgi:hypothetical protein